MRLPSPPASTIAVVTAVTAAEDPERAARDLLALIDRLNADGAAHVTRTVLDGRTVLRVSIGARTTERRHVVALWESIRAG